MISFLGNLIWLIFGGFVAAAMYIIGGALLCLTIIGIPFALKDIQLAQLALAPVGKTIVDKR